MLTKTTIESAMAALRVCHESLDEPSAHFSVETQRIAQAEIDGALEELQCALTMQEGDTPVAATPQPTPDWSQAPEWAQWWSMDQDGKQQWWEKKPVLDDRYAWWLYDWSHFTTYRHKRVEFRPDENGIDWRETLQQRPQPWDAAKEVDK